MWRHFDFDAREYYSHLHLSRNILFLYANRLAMQVASGLFAVFTAVFFYEQFNGSFTYVMLIFGSLYLGFVVLNPLSALLIKYIGMKRMLITASFLVPFTYGSLLFWEINSVWALAGFMTAAILYRTLYWTPYHIDFAKFTDRKTRGKQMSLLLNLSEVIITLTPIIAGVVIAAYGFNYLFIIAIVFLLLSIIPLFFIKDIAEEYTFGYFGTFKRLFEKKNRPLFFAYFGDGIQTSVRIAIWPIFIYTLLKGEYVTIGMVTSLTIFLLIAIRFLIGGLEDRFDRRKLLRFGSFFSTTGWVLKAFIETGFQIFVVDTYHKVGRAVNRLAFNVVAYDQAADNGHYIDEYTVLKETALNLGRGFMLFLAIWLTSAFSITATFLFAAGATLLMTLVNKDVFLQ